MISAAFLLMVLIATAESISCPPGQQPCGSSACYDPSTQGCSNSGSTIICIKSCNGTCYGNSQVCYNNTKVCNIDESFCDIKYSGYPEYFGYGPTCYNASQRICYNNTLCSRSYACGNKCINDYYSACANNQTICYGFRYYDYYYSGKYLNTCGPQKKCFDNSTDTCIDNNGTICTIGSQFCDGICYNPRTQYCIGGNNSIFCLSNPSSSLCSSNSTTTTVTTPKANNICCSNRNCTTNADCCRSDGTECRCYRHSSMDSYGNCVNPNISPVCGDDCPVQARCSLDSDCCGCQCADITFTNADGQRVARKQCVKR